jgi:hypothetical protein
MSFVSATVKNVLLTVKAMDLQFGLKIKIKSMNPNKDSIESQLNASYCYLEPE